MKFESYHPVITLLYFMAAFVFTIVFSHPICLGIALTSSFICSRKLVGKRVTKYIPYGLIFVLLYGAWYATNHHFGITVVGTTWIGNQITIESFVYGLSIGLRILTLIFWVLCTHVVMTRDKIIYLTGIILPRSSILLSILFRVTPSLSRKAKYIELGQSGLGRGVHQGKYSRRLIAAIHEISILITWQIDEFMELSSSMRGRGMRLKNRKIYSIFRFDYRDRVFVLILFFLGIVNTTGYALEQMTMLYNPELIWKPWTIESSIFATSYGIFMLIPVIVEYSCEVMFAWKRRGI